MTSKSLIATLVGAATVAAAGGGYLAGRHNVSDPSTVVESQTLPVSAPVQTTEGVVPVESPAVDRPAVAYREAPASPPAPRRAVPDRPQPPRVQQSPPVEPVEPPAPALQVTTAAPVTEPAARDIRYESASMPPAPPAPRSAEELTVARDSVIGIRLDSNISSETARVEDKVTARVARDVTVDGHTAISSGARLEGVVSSVERGGKFKERGRIGVRFNSLVLADGTRLPIETETIFREGDSPTRQAATKVGASAAIGGVIGAVFGGKKGAAIGSTVGAAGGTAAVVTGHPADVTLPAGTALTVRLTEPITVMIQRED
jgi:hypothetical protein